ncbi:MAG: DUF6036 family nucleotidyltransferase [Anaerolineales bacterium]
MLNQDFKEFFESLNANQVRYLVIGGYAVAFHGHPRYTKDIDVWIEMSAENADRIIKALSDFGFGSLDFKPDDFLKPDQIIQLGYEPDRIDILTTIPGVNFAECHPKHIMVTANGVEITVIDLENLIRSKKASGRLQDLADVEDLDGG